MLAKAAAAIRDEVCARFGVSVREFTHGSQLRTNCGRWPAQFSVSLARYTCMYELWKAGADHHEAGILLGMQARNAKYWFDDFTKRQKARAA